VRQRRFLLAAAAGLAGRRRLATRARAHARASAAAGPDRPRHRGSRFEQRPGRGRWKKTGPNPTDRRKPGTKHHVATDASGVPLACAISGANRPDGEFLLGLIDAIPKIRGKGGPPVSRPACVVADKAYAWKSNVDALIARGIAPWLPERGTDEDRSIGIFRWVVERTLAWLHQLRRLRVRYDRRDDIHQALLSLGCVIVCHRQLQRSF
jgi:hypothetical protein